MPRNDTPEPQAMTPAEVRAHNRAHEASGREVKRQEAQARRAYEKALKAQQAELERLEAEGVDVSGVHTH